MAIYIFYSHRLFWSYSLLKSVKQSLGYENSFQPYYTHTFRSCYYLCLPFSCMLYVPETSFVQALWIQGSLEHKRKIRNERGQPYHAMIPLNLLKDPHYVVFKVCKKSGMSQWGITRSHNSMHSNISRYLCIENTSVLQFLPHTMNPCPPFAVMPSALQNTLYVKGGDFLEEDLQDSSSSLLNISSWIS